MCEISEDINDDTKNNYTSELAECTNELKNNNKPILILIKDLIIKDIIKDLLEKERNKPKSLNLKN